MEVTMRNYPAHVTLTKLTAATDTPLEWSEGDHKMVLAVNATADTDLTVLAGNGIQGGVDMTVAIKTGLNLIKLESGLFKNVSGDNKGKIVVRSTGTPSVGVAALV